MNASTYRCLVCPPTAFCRSAGGVFAERCGDELMRRLVEEEGGGPHRDDRRRGSNERWRGKRECGTFRGGRENRGQYRKLVRSHPFDRGRREKAGCNDTRRRGHELAKAGTARASHRARPGLEIHRPGFTKPLLEPPGKPRRWPDRREAPGHHQRATNSCVVGRALLADGRVLSHGHAFRGGQRSINMGQVKLSKRAAVHRVRLGSGQRYPRYPTLFPDERDHMLPPERRKRKGGTSCGSLIGCRKREFPPFRGAFF